jgi:hypothetical protein
MIINIGFSATLFYINLIAIRSDSYVFLIKQPKLFNVSNDLGGLAPHAKERKYTSASKC